MPQCLESFENHWSWLLILTWNLLAGELKFDLKITDFRPYHNLSNAKENWSHDPMKYMHSTCVESVNGCFNDLQLLQNGQRWPGATAKEVFLINIWHKRSNWTCWTFYWGKDKMFCDFIPRSECSILCIDCLYNVTADQKQRSKNWYNIWYMLKIKAIDFRSSHEVTSCSRELHLAFVMVFQRNFKSEESLKYNAMNDTFNRMSIQNLAISNLTCTVGFQIHCLLYVQQNTGEKMMFSHLPWVNRLEF